MDFVMYSCWLSKITQSEGKCSISLRGEWYITPQKTCDLCRENCTALHCTLCIYNHAYKVACGNIFSCFCWNLSVQESAIVTWEWPERDLRVTESDLRVTWAFLITRAYKEGCFVATYFRLSAFVRILCRRKNVLSQIRSRNKPPTFIDNFRWSTVSLLFVSCLTFGRSLTWPTTLETTF